MLAVGTDTSAEGWGILRYAPRQTSTTDGGPVGADRDQREARDRLRRYTARQQVHSAQARRRRRDSLLGAAVAVVALGLATAGQVALDATGPGTPDATSSPTAAPTAEGSGTVPDPALAEDREWTGTLQLNDDVELGFTLDGTAAPQATAVLVDLIGKGFYEGTTCHRMSDAPSAQFLQCGSANGDGTGDAGYTFGPLEDVPADGLYPTGTIAMARGASPDSQSTQFFVTYGDTYLDSSTGGYTVVGTVTSGLDQLESAITDQGLTPSSEASPSDGAPVVPTTITGITVE